MSWTERYFDADSDGTGDGTTTALTGANGAWNASNAAAANTAINTALAGPASVRLNVKKSSIDYAFGATTITWNATNAAANFWVRGYNTTPGDLDLDYAYTLARPTWTFTTGQLLFSGAKQIISDLDVTSQCVTANGAVNISGANNKGTRLRVTNTAANANARAMTAAASINFTQCVFTATQTATVCFAGAAGTNCLACSFVGGITAQTGACVNDFCKASGYVTNGFSPATGYPMRGCTAVGGTVGFNGVLSNLFDCVADGCTTGFILTNAGSSMNGCSAYNATTGISFTSASNQVKFENCVLSTCTTGIAVTATSYVAEPIGCFFYACTTKVSGVNECATDGDSLFDGRGNKVLSGDPFFDATNHDLRLRSNSPAYNGAVPPLAQNPSYVPASSAGALQGFVSPPGAGLKRFSPTYGAG